MKTDPQAPADTRPMGIVHSALRRDLERTRVALTSAPYPDGARRRAIGDHLLAIMRFLHEHHSGEDAGLWPVVLAKDPSAAPLLASLEADHERIAPAITALEQAAAGYRTGTTDRAAVLDAVGVLREVLLPHLEREETEGMPLVSATLTQADWDTYEQKTVLKAKTFVELGDEGQWALDGLGEADRAVMLGLVPAVPRFVLQHGFARRYRRKRDLLWGDGPAARIPSLSLAASKEQG
ncbi:MAG: hemerythrin domain-containing protein [Nocardioidaceae bacterium]